MTTKIMTLVCYFYLKGLLPRFVVRRVLQYFLPGATITIERGHMAINCDKQ